MLHLSTYLLLHPAYSFYYSALRYGFFTLKFTCCIYTDYFSFSCIITHLHMPCCTYLHCCTPVALITQRRWYYIHFCLFCTIALLHCYCCTPVALLTLLHICCTDNTEWCCTFALLLSNYSTITTRKIILHTCLFVAFLHCCCCAHAALIT